MSFKVKGALKSRDKTGASIPKKRVHFADEGVAGGFAPAIPEHSKEGGAGTQAGACGWASGATDFVEEFRRSCNVDAENVSAMAIHDGLQLPNSFCPSEDRELNSTASNSKVTTAISTTELCEVGDNCCIEDERVCTPPFCVVCSKSAVFRPHPREGGVQKRLDFGGARDRLPTRKNMTRSQNCYYKVVPEVEVGGLSAIVLGRQQDAQLQMQATFEDFRCRKRCAWISPQSDPAYVAYHDEEWGVPVHDDRRLFELLVFAGAQAEVAWPCLLAKREVYRSIFHQFDPAILATLDMSEMESCKSGDDIMRSEARVQAIVSNAKLVVKIAKEYGSFDAYLWSFVGNKPIVNKYKQPNLIPARTGKSAAISKDLQRRGFRHTGPIVVYAMMQAAGLANAHLTSCFRHHDLAAAPAPSSPSTPPRPRPLASSHGATAAPRNAVSPLCY